VKKYLAVLLGVIFLLSFTVTAFAIHEEMPSPVDTGVVAKGPTQITLGGKIIERGWFFDNVDGISPTDSPSQALYTTNVYLTVDAKVSDNLRAFLELETSNKESNNSGVFYWGAYDTKNDMELKFRQAWIQYTGSGLLGAPAGIKVGHMPIVLGEKIFLNNERFGDDAILVWVDPTKELHLVAGTVKLVESANTNIGHIDHHQDLDGYVLVADYMWDKDNTIGANWTWTHSDHNLPSLSHCLEDANGNCNIFLPDTDELNFHNIGIHANGKLGGFTYAAEGDFQFGKAKNIVFGDEDTGDVTALGDQKFKGWGAMAKVGYMIDPLNIRAMFAIGSGDDGDDAGKIKEFQTLQGTDATGAIARLTHYTLIYERLIRTAAVEAVVTTFPGGNIRSTGIANTMVYNVGIDLNPVKELSLSLDGFLLQATENGAWENLVGGYVSKNIGQEVDLKLNYQIARNLSYFAEAGMFFPGRFYTTSSPAFYGEEIGKKTTTMAVHGLLLAF